MPKTHHKMIGWNREFQYLPAKIIGEIVKSQYLPTKTIHFSFSHLTLSSLSHIPLSPLFFQLWSTLNHSLSLLDNPYLNLFSCISSEGWARSWLFLRASVRACVPLLGEAQNLCFCTILSKISKSHLCILPHLATVAFKIGTFFVPCSKQIIKWDVEIVNFNTSQLKS